MVIAVGIHLVRGAPKSVSQHMARLGAALVAAVALSYLVVGFTYRLGLPLLKLSNLLAYLASIVMAAGIGWLFYRFVHAVLSRVARNGRAPGRLRIGVPAILALGLAVIILLPPVFLRKMPIVQQAATTPTTDGVQAAQPNIVFILIDTLRADHLPMYGYSRQTAPNLSALAEQGMTFTSMYAQSSYTRPSVATLFSSLYPTVHKTNYGRDFLPSSIVTLAETLHEAGYETFGTSANSNVAPMFGFAQGFDAFSVSNLKSSLRLTMLGSVIEDAFGDRGFRILETAIVPRAEVITDDALKWSARNCKKPCFLYVHYIDPHAPYSPPSPYDQAFDRQSDPPIRVGGVDPIPLAKGPKRQAWVGKTLDQYDGEILYTDHHIGRLLKGLKQFGILEQALVIVTSDHGEEFYEHGHQSHGNTLYEEVLRVPFMLSWPSRIPAGSTYENVAGLIDVMPTLLNFLDIAPPSGLQGISFADDLTKAGTAKPEKRFFAQLITDRLGLEMVRHRQYKFMRHVHGPREEYEELYDLQRDPLERTNMAQQPRAPVAVWRKDLDLFNKYAHQAASLVPKEQSGQLSPEVERALRALGYIK